MKIFREVLEPSLFESFQIYVSALAQTPLMKPDTQSDRLMRHNDPFAVLIHQSLTRPLQDHIGHVKPSYVFVARYREGAVLAPHYDRPQCKYTLDVCIEDGGVDQAWPLYVDEQPVVLAPNQGVLYRGCEQLHYRHEMPVGKIASLAFFHFVDEDFEGPLN